MIWPIYWADNIWVGVTVENAVTLHRITTLQECRGPIKFISAEPLLSSLDGLDLNCINWVIVGGESGPGARPMKHQCVIDIRDKCVSSNVPLHFKQWGGINKKVTGRILRRYQR
jgi:protein gp37